MYTGVIGSLYRKNSVTSALYRMSCAISTAYGGRKFAAKT